MNVVILTGGPWSHVETLFGKLDSFGVKKALPAELRNSIDIGSWHDRLFSGQQGNGFEQLHLGKAWEQAAGEIFLGNWDQDTWGWADSRTTWVLEFWRDFDPKTRFILANINPQQALADAIEQAGNVDSFSLDDVLRAWLTHERELLRFFLRNPQRCVLVDADQARRNPAALAQAASDAFALDLKLEDAGTLIEAIPEEESTGNSHLATLLARHVLQRFPDAQSLWQEIATSITVLANAPPVSRQDETKLVSDAINELRHIAQHAREALAQLSQARNDCEAQAQAREAAEQMLAATEQGHRQLLVHQHQLQEELQQISTTKQSLDAELQTANSKLKNEQQIAQDLKAQIDKLAVDRDAQARATNAAEQKLCAQQQESELLLLQLHQVQEELEVVFLNNQQLNAELQAANNSLVYEKDLAQNRQVQIDQITADRDHQSRNATESQQRIVQLTKAGDDAAKRLQDRQAQIDKLTADLDAQARIATERQQRIVQLTKAGDDAAKRLQDRQAQIDKLTADFDAQARTATESQQRIVQLTKALDDTAKRLQDRQGQIDKLTADLDTQARTATALHQQNAQLTQDRDAQAQATNGAEQRFIAQQQESELLLLQLHQVQEELEHYFLLYQEEQKKRERADQRLTRVCRHYPDFVDLGNLQIKHSASRNSQEVTMIATDAQNATRCIEHCALRIQLRNKEPTLIIERADTQQSGPLLRWPVQFANVTSLTIAAAADQNSSALESLATSDWQLLQALCQTFAQALQNGVFELDGDSSKFSPALWQNAFTELREFVQKSTSPLRYDTVTLKRQQVNPDYEHLWFTLSNLRFSEKQWQQAEFRFSAALVKKGKFSIHPKLEFPQPQIGQPLFESWQADLEDDYGPKMELRFEIRTQAVDLGVWSSLSSTDQKFVLALIDHLPIILTDLAQQKTQISRAWDDWKNLAHGVIDTIKARQIELGIQPVASPTPRTPLK